MEWLEFSLIPQLREDYFRPWDFKIVSASAYKMCPHTEGYRNSALVEKPPGPQFGVHLREVSAHGRSPQAEVRL